MDNENNMKNKKEQDQFSIQKRIISFKFAFKGITWLIRTQHNMWIHLLAAAIVVTAGFYFSVTKIEWILLAITIGMVLSAEAFNTAIELLVDKISPEFNLLAGRIKDVAAGAVLITASIAVIVGLLIFLPKIMG